MKDFKVTILISVYNPARAALNRCFDSLYRQTTQNFEILCVNDSSTNTSAQRTIERWQSKFCQTRFKIIVNPNNLGLTKSLNKGLDLIETDYTARIDGDDWWHKDKLKTQLDFLSRNPQYDIVGCNYINVNAFNLKQYKIVMPQNDRDIKKRLIINNAFAHSSVIYSTRFIKGLGGYANDIRYGQDYELWLRAMPKAKFYNVQSYLCYRTFGVGISASKQKKQMKQVFKFKLKYLIQYKLPLIGYLSLFIYLIPIITPDFIINIKRKRH